MLEHFPHAPADNRRKSHLWKPLSATTCGFNPSAYGKVPHEVAERGFHRWGFLRLSAGACGKCSNIYFFIKMVSNISVRSLISKKRLN